MIFTVAIIGAIAGWIFAELETYGLVIGGMIGALAGLAMRFAVRREIATATAGLRAQIDVLRAAVRDGLAPEARPGPRSPNELIATPGVRPAAAVSAAAVPPAVLAPSQVTSPAYVAPRVQTPAAPDPVTEMAGKVGAAIRNWLFGGNTIVRVGLVILFVGLSFLASYAASVGLFPIEFRLAFIAMAGMALLVVGFRTRVKRPEFGLTLQGGGVATLYLTLFAAARLFDVVPALAAFVLMILVCVLGCALALLQRSQAMAMTSFAGGFAVPLLLSTGGGNIAAVFAYYTVLNLAILFIAQRQSWRGLNLIGFFATFGITSVWMALSYQPTDYPAAQAFVIVSVLIYLATAVLYTRGTPGRLGNVVDTTLLFGPALAGFGLQVALVHDRPFGSAFAALGFALMYLGVAAFTLRYRRESFRVMNEAMLAIGIGFVTLAVPLALGATWTSAVWALEGAGAFWVGMRQARWMPRLFGLLLQLAAAFAYMVGSGENISALPIANPAFVGAMLIALSALVIAWWLRKPLAHSGSWFAGRYAAAEVALAIPAFLFGFAFWWGTWIFEVTRALPPVVRSGMPPEHVFDLVTRFLLVMLAYVLSAFGAQAIARRTGWAVAAWPSRASLIALGLAFVGQVSAGGHVLETPGWAVWIVAAAVHLRMLYLNDAADTPALRPLLGATHVGGVWLATLMLADCLWLGVDRAGLWETSWAGLTFQLSVLAVLVLLTAWAGRSLKAQAKRWPLDRHAVAYAWYAALPIAALAFFGALVTATIASGQTDPLPYLPLLNPVDLTLALSLAALELWRRAIVAANPAVPGSTALGETPALAALAGLAFIMVNTVWMRAAHHLLGIEWNPEALLASVVVQTGIAILWTVLALGLMIAAHRRGQRKMWLVGAGLLGLTVVKLLLVDLNAAGGGARIIAFIVVGVLMLVVGYMAPLPPRASEAPAPGDAEQAGATT
ncbi:putative membrane protein [Sphingomonas sp. UYAg733]